jgi:hypothetical protein
MGQHLSSRRFGNRAGQAIDRVYRIFDIRHKNLDCSGFRGCILVRRCGGFPHFEQGSKENRQRLIQFFNPTFFKSRGRALVSVCIYARLLLLLPEPSI